MILPKPRPQARTGVSSPNSGWVTSGLKMPAPPNSIHFFLIGWKTSTSVDRVV